MSLLRKNAAPLLPASAGTLVAPGVVVPPAPVMPDDVCAVFTTSQHALSAHTDALLSFEAFYTMAWKPFDAATAGVSEFMLSNEWAHRSASALPITLSPQAAADLVALSPLAPPAGTTSESAEDRMRELAGAAEVFSTSTRTIGSPAGRRYWDAKHAALGDRQVNDEASVTETVTTVGVSPSGVSVSSSTQVWSRHLTFVTRSDMDAAVGHMVPAVVVSVDATDSLSVTSSAITLHAFSELHDLRIDVRGDDVAASFRIGDRTFHVGADALRAIQAARAMAVTA